MVKFGLRIKSFYTLIKATIYFYLLSFVFGGILDWIFLMIPSLEEYRVGVLGLLSVILIITIVMYTIIQKIIHKKKSNFYSVQIKNKGTVIKLTALLDTGNHLVEPISNRPVSIIEKSVIQDMLVKKELRGYCIIPFHSVGKEHGIMEGYELEAIEIKVEDGIVRKEKAVVAVCEGNISNSKQYQMILNPKLLED